jgi:hypothetical protein
VLRLLTWTAQGSDRLGRQASDLSDCSIRPMRVTAKDAGGSCLPVGQREWQSMSRVSLNRGKEGILTAAVEEDYIDRFSTSKHGGPQSVRAIDYSKALPMHQDWWQYGVGVS